MLKKQFRKTIIPAMIAFFLSGIYVSIDGLFVGNSVGDEGLAAINIAWPVVAIILALGVGIGMGGSIHMSIQRGAGNEDKAQQFQGNTLLMLFLAALFTTTVFYFFATPILALLGAKGAVLEMTTQYVQILALGSLFQIAGQGTNPLLRNQGKPWIAMAMMILNFVLDTSLSGIFTLYLGYGVAGAAIASVIGQGMAFLPILYLLFNKSNRVPLSAYKLSTEGVQKIVSAGLSPFALSFIPALTTLILNLQVAHHGGTVAVASFAVLGYIFSVGQLLIQGISDGAQPLISFQYGANHQENVILVRKWTYQTAIIVGILIFGLAWLGSSIIPIVFNTSTQAAQLLHLAIPLYLASLPFYAITRVTTSFVNAIGKNHLSSLLTYGEGLVLVPILAILLPLLFQLNGVWVTVLVSQMILSSLSYLLVKKLKQD